MVRVTIDEWEGKKALHSNHMDWLIRNEPAVIRFADNHIAYKSRYEFISRIYNNDDDAFTASLIIKTIERYTNSQRIYKLLRSIRKKGGLHIFVGGRGSGKTYLAYFAAYQLHKMGERIWYLGPPVELPDFIEGSTIDFDKVPENVIVIMDEVSVQFFSRKAGTNKHDEVIQKLPLVRQTKKTYIVITQNLYLQDTNFLRQVSSITLTKTPILQEETERTSRKIKLMEDLNIFLPEKVGTALYYDDDQLFRVNIPLLSWWKDEYSNPYRSFHTEAEKYRFIIKLSKDLDDPDDIAIQLGLRSSWMEPMEIEKMLLLTKDYDFNYLLSLNDNELINLIEMGYDDTPINDMVHNKFKKIKGNFKMRKIHEQFLNQKLEYIKEHDPNMWLYYNRNMNTKFLEDIRDSMLVDEQNIVISIIGYTGTGKTLGSMSIATVIADVTDTEFSPEMHLWYNADDIMNNLRYCKRYNTMIRDEQEKERGSGSVRKEEDLARVERTIRKEQINLIYNSPTLRSHVHHYVLETAGFDKKHKIWKLLVYSPDMKYLSGYITVAVPPKKIIDEYLIKKDKYTEQQKNRESSSNKDEIAQKLLNYKPYIDASNTTERVAAVGRYFRENNMGDPTQTEAHEISGLAKLLMKGF